MNTKPVSPEKAENRKKLAKQWFDGANDRYPNRRKVKADDQNRLNAEQYMTIAEFIGSLQISTGKWDEYVDVIQPSLVRLDEADCHTVLEYRHACFLELEESKGF